VFLISVNVGIVYGPVLRATVTDASEPPIEFAVYLEGTESFSSCTLLAVIVKHWRRNVFGTHG